MITIPCNYHHPEGTGCENGQVLIYGEHGGRLPETIVCPKCKGESHVLVERSVIENQINDLQGEMDEIACEIETLQNYLIQGE